MPQQRCAPHSLPAVRGLCGCLSLKMKKVLTGGGGGGRAHRHHRDVLRQRQADAATGTLLPPPSHSLCIRVKL